MDHGARHDRSSLANSRGETGSRNGRCLPKRLSTGPHSHTPCGHVVAGDTLEFISGSAHVDPRRRDAANGNQTRAGTKAPHPHQGRWLFIGITPGSKLRPGGGLLDLPRVQGHYARPSLRLSTRLNHHRFSHRHWTKEPEGVTFGLGRSGLGSEPDYSFSRRNETVRPQSKP